MKLLTTIAAVLISISAFSQDYVEYNEGVFLRYGEEISLDKVEHLMNQYRVPFYQVHLNGVKKQIRNCGNEYRRIGMLSLSIIETPVLALGTGLFGFITLWAWSDGEMGGAVTSGFVTVGCAAGTANFTHLAYVHSTKDRCQNKVDKLCEKLIFQLNKKIEAKYKLLGY
jgi:hypothetical protein